jgi:hypothetical protein
MQIISIVPGRILILGMGLWHLTGAPIRARPFPARFTFEAVLSALDREPMFKLGLMEKYMFVGLTIAR